MVSVYSTNISFLCNQTTRNSSLSMTTWRCRQQVPPNTGINLQYSRFLKHQATIPMLKTLGSFKCYENFMNLWYKLYCNATFNRTCNLVSRLVDFLVFKHLQNLTSLTVQFHIITKFQSFFSSSADKADTEICEDWRYSVHNSCEAMRIELQEWFANDQGTFSTVSKYSNV